MTRNNHLKEKTCNITASVKSKVNFFGIYIDNIDKKLLGRAIDLPTHKNHRYCLEDTEVCNLFNL